TGSASTQSGVLVSLSTYEANTGSADENSSPNTASSTAVMPSPASVGTTRRRAASPFSGPARNHGSGPSASSTDAPPLSTPSQPCPAPDTASAASPAPATSRIATSQSASLTAAIAISQ